MGAVTDSGFELLHLVARAARAAPGRSPPEPPVRISGRVSSRTTTSLPVR